MSDAGNRLCLAVALSLHSVASAGAQTFLGGHVRPPAFVPQPSFAAGQIVQKPAGPPPTPRHTGVKALFKDLGRDFRHIPSKENLFWAGVGGGLALAVHPADDNVNEALVGSDVAGRIFKPGQILGELPTLLSAATIIYATGRIRDQPKVSHMGMDLIEALVVSETITQTLKYATRRERPDGSGKTSFRPGTRPTRSPLPPRSNGTSDGDTRLRRMPSPPTSRFRGCRPIGTGSVTPCSAPRSASSPAAP